MWGGVLGWFFSSLCADACENPRFTNHNHHSAHFPIMFPLVRSRFQECPPRARFSKTANEAESLPGGAAITVIFQPPNADSRCFIRAATFGNCSLGTQSNVYWKDENKNLPLTSILVGFGSALKCFSIQHVFVFLFWITFFLPSLFFPHPSPFRIKVARSERDSAFQAGQIRSVVGIFHRVQIYLEDVNCLAWPAGCYLLT